MKTNNYEEPRVMRELHAIREKHYEETKHMSNEEYVKWVNEKAEKLCKSMKWNINTADKN